MKKIILLVLLTSVLPVFAYENTTLQSNFSGYKNDYSLLNKSYKTSEQQRKDIMKPVSVKEMVNKSSEENVLNNQINKLPQSYDSYEMLHMQGLQNGIQNMYMGL